MARTFATDVIVDLSNAGSSATVSMLGFDTFSVEPTNIAAWGTTAIVSIKKVVGGVAESYGTPKTIQSGATERHRDVATETAEAIKLEVTTPDSNATAARIRVVGEGKE